MLARSCYAGAGELSDSLAIAVGLTRRGVA